MSGLYFLSTRDSSTRVAYSVVRIDYEEMDHLVIDMRLLSARPFICPRLSILRATYPL